MMQPYHRSAREVVLATRQLQARARAMFPNTEAEAQRISEVADTVEEAARARPGQRPLPRTWRWLGCGTSTEAIPTCSTNWTPDAATWAMA